MARQAGGEMVTVSVDLLRDAISLIDSNEGLLEVAVLCQGAAEAEAARLAEQMARQQAQLNQVNEQLTQITAKTGRLRAMFHHVGLGR
jgi:hypothetical protein